MALIYCTGFDYSTNLGDYFFNWNAGEIKSGGRHSSSIRYFYIREWFGNYYARISLMNNYDEIIFGFAHYYLGNPNTDGFFSIQNVNYETNLSIGLTSDRRFRIITPVSSFETNFVTAPNVWYYLEVKTKTHFTNGNFTFRVNGVTLLSQSNIRTSASSTNQHNRYLYFYSANAERLFDDLYVCDTTGTKNNDFLGDVKIVTLFPTRNGTYNQFDVFNASSQYLAVDETSPNNDTDYVAQSGINLAQTFGFTAPTISGSILGLKVNHFMKKDDAGSRFVKLLGKYGTNEDLSQTISLTDSYIYYSKIYEQRIGSQNDWSLSDLDTVEFGVKIVES